MSTPTQAQLVAILNNAVVRASINDAAFRARLLADPKATIEQELQLPLPAGFSLKVLEAGPTDHTIVLPYQPTAGADGELSDADLESVAGGSKAGAKKFFNGFMDGLNNGTSSVKSASGGEGKTGAVFGTIGSFLIG